MRNPFRRKPTPPVLTPNVQVFWGQFKEKSEQASVDAVHELGAQLRKRIEGAILRQGLIERPSTMFADLYDRSGIVVGASGSARIAYLTTDRNVRRVWAVDGRLLKSFPAVTP